MPRLPSSSSSATKEASSDDELVGRHVLYKWPVVGWCVGKIVERNQDAQGDGGERIKVNFFIHYEIDQQKAKTVLRLNEYNGDEDGAWVLLEAVGAGGTD